VARDDDSPRQLFAFRDAYAARRFVFRVARALDDVAILVDDVHVLVIDGGEPHDWPRRQTLIAQLGRESSERWLDIAATLVRRDE
jgi:hypothetical protein